MDSKLTFEKEYKNIPRVAGQSLGSNWGTICTTLGIPTKGGLKKLSPVMRELQEEVVCSIVCRNLNTVVSRASTTEEEIIFKTKLVTEVLEVTTPMPVEGNSFDKETRKYLEGGDKNKS